MFVPERTKPLLITFTLFHSIAHIKILHRVNRSCKVSRMSEIITHSVITEGRMGEEWEEEEEEEEAGTGLNWW